MKKNVIATAVATLVLVVVIGVAAWLIILYSGVYNISTSSPDNAVVDWALDKGMTRSVVRHSKGISPPPLTDQRMIQEGFEHYDEMCVICHGAPGTSPGEIAKGLRPNAPNLGKTAPEWTPAQLFWITRNGIKFTAMPAWGPTHSDEKIWAIVAFLRKLPQLSPDEYQQMHRELAGQKDR